MSRVYVLFIESVAGDRLRMHEKNICLYFFYGFHTLRCDLILNRLIVLFFFFSYD